MFKSKMTNVYFQFFEDCFASCEPQDNLSETKQLFNLFKSAIDDKVANKIIHSMKFFGFINNEYILRPFHFNENSAYAIAADAGLYHSKICKQVYNYIIKYRLNNKALNQLDKLTENNHRVRKPSAETLLKANKYSSKIDKEFAGVTDIKNNKQTNQLNDESAKVKPRVSKITNKHDRIILERKLAQKRAQKRQQIIKEEQQEQHKESMWKKKLLY